MKIPALVAAVAALVLVPVVPTLAQEPRVDPVRAMPRVTGNVCLDLDVPNALRGTRSGTLIAPPQDVTTASGIAFGRLFRVAYATYGPGGRLEASCGLVAVPPTGSSLTGVVAWAHGTVGLKQSCQPSMDPASLVAPMSTGIGAPLPGGSQESGALVSLLRDGRAVVAADYYARGMGGTDLQRYVMGVPSGLAVLDAARSLTASASAFGLAPIASDARLPLVTWGHSQGGGAALWAGQLARQYLTTENDRTLDLAGVAALAPAAQFTTSPRQPRAWRGFHLGDRDIYNNAPGIGVPFPIGTVLFSFVTASWSQVRDATAGPLPFGPTSDVSREDVLSTDGLSTAPVIADSCLSGRDLITVGLASLPYLNPDRTRLLASPMDGTRQRSGWVGGVDSTCASPAAQSSGVREWCAWMQFNMPGPYGVNPYSKVPANQAGDAVPLYVGQGRDDRIMWCVDSTGDVGPVDCLAAQLQRAFAPVYCRSGGVMRADYFTGVDHQQIPGAAALNPRTGAFAGSPLDTFIRGAMSGSLASGCTTSYRRNPLPR